MSRPTQGILRIFLLLTLIILLSFASIMLMGRIQQARADTQDIYKYLEVFNQAMDLIEKNYVKEIDSKTLIYGAIQGMLSHLDPHSVHLPPEYFKEMKLDLTGKFGGLGIEIGIRQGRLTIISPIEDTPAWKAGLKAGDVILKINGESTEGMSLMDAVKRLRGKKGTSVTITVYRKEWEEPKDITIVRDIIKIKSVKKVELIDQKYGYIRLATFNENTASELHQAMRLLLDRKAHKEQKLAGLILDLRNNPGGPLEQALEVADAFLSEGPIVSIRGRTPTSESKTYYAHKQNTYTGFPMIVLVNAGSASASEIVASALQDAGRAIILGTRTYGKGSVQALYTLKDGSGLKLTTAYYYTPRGSTIQGEGIKPDIIVEELSPEEQEILEKERKEAEEKRLREEKLPRYIHPEEVKPEEEKPKEEEEFEQEILKDYQLRRAVELLRSWEVFQAQFKKSSKQ